MSDEYVRKDVAVDALKSANGSLYWNTTLQESLVQLIQELPPADVVPVVHGRWVSKPNIYGVAYCSKCDYELHTNDTNYCPNCGAIMDREE